MPTSSGKQHGKQQKEPRELAALDKARAKVERLEREWRASIRERNDLVRAAKAAGVPAATAYERAGVTQSTFSRQQDATDG